MEANFYLSVINEAAVTNIERVHDEHEDESFKDGPARVPKHEGCKDELRREEDEHFGGCHSCQEQPHH